MKIYLAGPFFNKPEIEANDKLLKIVKDTFKKDDLYIPKSLRVERKSEVLPHHVWARNVFIHDVAMLDQSDLVIAYYGGLYSDTGTAWELGYAYAKGIPTIVVTNPDTIQSLMPYFGSTQLATFDTIESVLKNWNPNTPNFK